MRGRTGNGVPGGGASPSPALGRPKRGRSPCLCCKVDRRREEERLGIVANGLNGWMGVGKEGESPLVGLEGAVSELLSNILKSVVKLDACMLRRFAEGLPREA